MAQPYKPINQKELANTLQDAGTPPKTPKRQTADPIIEDTTTDQDSDTPKTQKPKKHRLKKMSDPSYVKHKKLIPATDHHTKKKQKTKKNKYPEIQLTRTLETPYKSHPEETAEGLDDSEEYTTTPLTLDELEDLLHINEELKEISTNTLQKIKSSITNAKREKQLLELKLKTLKRTQQPNLIPLTDLKDLLKPFIEVQNELLQQTRKNTQDIENTQKHLKEIKIHTKDTHLEQEKLIKEEIYTMRQNNNDTKELRQEIQEYMETNRKESIQARNELAEAMNWLLKQPKQLSETVTNSIKENLKPAINTNTTAQKPAPEPSTYLQVAQQQTLKKTNCKTSRSTHNTENPTKDTRKNHRPRRN